ncbi:MAG: class I SAM-dependent RNA methyltransferase [Clostridia bacterium]|nr:class I SAM-dependent RNA methyltransferase [Clostridia bacterium]
MDLKFNIPCLLGTEKIIKNDLTHIGIKDARCENGMVFFTGNEKTMVQANISSRYAERVLIVLGEFKAFTFDELFEKVKALPIYEYLPKDAKFPVKGYSLNSTLFSVSDIQSIVKKAIVENLKKKYHLEVFPETGDLYQIQFSVIKDRFLILLDTTGPALHKRGYRTDSVLAPIKETLAASICEFSSLRPYHTFYDPMCGSGTIAIEAVYKACNIAPGINRNFSFENFHFSNSDFTKDYRDKCKSEINLDNDFRAFAFDNSKQAIEIAKENAKRAGVESKITFKIQDLADFEPLTERGTLITNPPYGERLLEKSELSSIYSIMREKFLSKRGWSYNIITSDLNFEEEFHKKADKRRKLYNGMIECNLYSYYK